MQTIYVVFNAFAYVIMSLVYWKRYKRMDLYLLISLLYGFTAIMCIYNFLNGLDKFPDLGLFAFVYLFIVITIFLAPIRNFDIERKQIAFEDNKFCLMLALVFLLAAIVDILTSLAHTSELVQSGMWAEMRNMGYNEEDSVVLYESPIQKLSKNLVSYLKPFAFVYAYYQLTKLKMNRLLTISLFMSIFMTSFISAAADASRGMVINLFIQLLICYLLFKNQIPKKRKKYIMLTASWVAYGFIAFLVAVSISRFGDEVWEYIFIYLGHSMLRFNDGLFYNMHDFAWGKKFFDFFYDLFGWNSYYDTDAFGSTAGHGFVTFVGSLFIDFGPFGTILVAIIAVYIIKRFFEKDFLCLSDMIMIVFYANTMANGIFVSSRNRALAWVMTFVIYYIVKKIETRKEIYYV